ncbi:MAG: hypothetical protein IPM46_09180 [Flavobacteriales bacterium]|nr:hypothetical protein [Flavobacteriales bacterium]
MRLYFALLAALLPFMGMACDVCGIFLGIQPHDRTSSISLLYRYRHLEGTVPTALLTKGSPKHGDHIATTANGASRYRELYQVAELRADIWLSDRFAVLAAIPVVNNYQAVDGIIRADVYGIGDPLVLGRYLVANTKCTTTDERTVHRLLLGAGAKLPLGRNDLTYSDAEVGHDLQPGTRTWDALLSAEYSVRHDRNGGSLTTISRVNTGNADGHRMGHGLSTTLEAFRRYDLREDLKLMPSLGVYHELSGKDAHNGEAMSGTGSSTFFTHTGFRVWWRSWAIMGTFQYAIVRHLGEQMIPNRERVVVGLTYNLKQN